MLSETIDFGLLDAPAAAASPRVNGVALNPLGQDLSADDLRQRACTELLRQQAMRTGLLANTDAMGARLIDNLRALAEKHKVIGDVRGKGLFCGAELVADRATKEPADEKKVAAVVADCMAQGVIIGMTNRSLIGLNNTLCFSPALIATADNIDHITDAVDRALIKVFN